MAISDILNKGACGATTQTGYNTVKGCRIPFKDIDELWLTDSDFEFDGSQDLTDTYIRSVQASGKLTILKNVVGFEAQNTENQFSTNSRGFKELAIDGIYEYKASFNEDVWFNAQLAALEGKRNKRVILVSNGTLFATEGKAEGNFRGHLAYSITRSLQTFTQGTEVAMQALEIQFANKKELDDNPVVISPDLWTAGGTDDIEPIVPVKIGFNTIPVNGDTTILMDLAYDRGMNLLKGVDFEFAISVNGNVQTVTSVIGTKSVYDLTVSPALATNDVVKVSFNGIQDVTGDCLYISDTASIDVIAST